MTGDEMREDEIRGERKSSKTRQDKTRGGRGKKRQNRMEKGIENSIKVRGRG